MQYCTTKYHPRPKCGRNIHRYINIKVSPIQTFLPIYSHIFFLSFFVFALTQLHVIYVFVKMSGLCLYMRVCVCVFGALCESLLSQPHAPSLQNHMLVKSNWDETLEGKVGVWGGRGQSKSKTEKFTVTDGR